MASPSLAPDAPATVDTLSASLHAAALSSAAGAAERANSASNEADENPSTSESPPNTRYVPPHRRARTASGGEAPPDTPPSAGAAPDRLTLMFGDSFMGMFKLLAEAPRPLVRVQIFKGATASGMGKGPAENANAQAVEGRLRQLGAARVRCLVFGFGQVDVHLSFYHKLLLQPPQPLDTARIARTYVAYVRQCGGAALAGVPRFVLAAYPSPVAAADMWTSLQRYHVVSPEEAAGVARDWDRFSRATRNAVLEEFNAALQRECEATAGAVQFLSINHHLVDDSGEVLQRFRDISTCNIHLLWESTIRLWTQTPLADYGVTADSLVNLKSGFDQYKQYKEGLLRRHGTEFGTFAHEEEVGKDVMEEVWRETADASRAEKNEQQQQQEQEQQQQEEQQQQHQQQQQQAQQRQRLHQDAEQWRQPNKPAAASQKIKTQEPWRRRDPPTRVEEKTAAQDNGEDVQQPEENDGWEVVKAKPKKPPGARKPDRSHVRRR